LQPALDGGAPCGPLAELAQCIGPVLCADECRVGEWSEYSNCSASCDVGWKSRSRAVSHTGHVCPRDTENTTCGTHPCKVDCEVRLWAAWDVCSQACGGGGQVRQRGVRVSAANGGQPCPPLTETRPCNSEPCARPCEVGEWKEWGSCSAECGEGRSLRVREVVKPSLNGGDLCPTLVDSDRCSVPAACDASCEVSAWDSWSHCRGTCTPGEDSFRRRYLMRTSGGLCPALVETYPCMTGPCASPCSVGDWGVWGANGALPWCPSATQYRYRPVVADAANGGPRCPSLVEARLCSVRLQERPSLSPEWQSVCEPGTLQIPLYGAESSMPRPESANASRTTSPSDDVTIVKVVQTVSVSAAARATSMARSFAAVLLTALRIATIAE
jgi:hypothetical protein